MFSEVSEGAGTSLSLVTLKVGAKYNGRPIICSTIALMSLLVIRRRHGRQNFNLSFWHSLHSSSGDFASSSAGGGCFEVMMCSVEKVLTRCLCVAYCF